MSKIIIEDLMNFNSKINGSHSLISSRDKNELQKIKIYLNRLKRLYIMNEVLSIIACKEFDEPKSNVRGHGSSTTT